MTRGRASQVGDTRWSPNGYHYTRTARGWQLTHRLVAEETLGRPVGEDERVRFLDGDRTNLDPDNIEVYKSKPQTPARRRAQIEAKIADLQAQLEELELEE